MEPKYLSKEVIIHPNHHLRFGAWILRERYVLEVQVQLFRMSFQICKAAVLGGWAAHLKSKGFQLALEIHSYLRILGYVWEIQIPNLRRCLNV